MKLSELYLPYEKLQIDKFFNQILERFKSEKKAPYVDKNHDPREDEYLELVNINYPSEYINIQRRFNNQEKWKVTYDEIKNAIKFTLRQGSIQGSGDYNKMTGTSNLVGTPLHILIALLPKDEYEKVSLVGKSLPHSKFGNVVAKEIDLAENHIVIPVEGKEKKIIMDYWEITEEEFNRVFNEQSA